MSIVHIPDEIKKEFKVTADGVAIVSIRGAARIADVAEATLRDHFKSVGASLTASKLGEMLIEAGFNGASLKKFSQLGIPDKALAIILEYYTFEAKDSCTELAKAAYRSFAAIGIRTWVQHELGYTRQGYSSEEQPHLIDTITYRELSFLKAMWHCGTNRAELYAALRQQVPEVFRDMPVEVCFQKWAERSLELTMPDLERWIMEELAKKVCLLDKKVLTNPQKLQQEIKQIEKQLRRQLEEQSEVKRVTEMATEPTSLEIVREYKAQLDLNQHLLPASERKPLPPLGMAKAAVGLNLVDI